MPEYKTVKEPSKIGYEYHVRSNGIKSWYLDGKFHRIDGPAILYTKLKPAWYLNGHPLSGRDIEIAKYLQDCPLSELPKYVNSIFVPIIRERLNA